MLNKDIVLIDQKSKKHLIGWLSILIILVFIPIPQVFATSSIANAVLSACAPNPTVPDVNSCSACHSTTNNRGPNDLTTAGTWSLSTATYNNFCPNMTPTPPPTPTPTPDPTPTPPPSGMGMSSQPPGSGMGRGKGGSFDDDDDDDDEDDDDDDYEDDDDDGSSASRFSRRGSSFGRSSRNRRRDD